MNRLYIYIYPLFLRFPSHLGNHRASSNSLCHPIGSHLLFIVPVQLSSVAQSCLTLCDPMNHNMPGLLVYHQLLESTQTRVLESVMPSNHLILCPPLLLLPSIFPRIRVFSNESALRMRWAKYWRFSFNISPSHEHPGLISFRMGWLDLLAVERTLKVFSNTTVQKHQFFCAQLSLYPTLTSIHNHWKNHSLE